ncbi:hypothetical protein BDF22DRAFT_688411, partial [Syncephalis plumigaleata]
FFSSASSAHFLLFLCAFLLSHITYMFNKMPWITPIHFSYLSLWSHTCRHYCSVIRCILLVLNCTILTANSVGSF